MYVNKIKIYLLEQKENKIKIIKIHINIIINKYNYKGEIPLIKIDILKNNKFIALTSGHRYILKFYIKDNKEIELENKYQLKDNNYYLIVLFNRPNIEEISIMGNYYNHLMIFLNCNNYRKKLIDLSSKIYFVKHLNNEIILIQESILKLIIKITDL